MTNTISPSRARWAAAGAALAVTLGAVGINATTGVGATTSSGERAVYNAITPCRLTDTRPASQVGPKGAPLATEDTETIAARGAQGNCSAMDLPTDATALALNVTAVGATLPTFLTIWDTGPRPDASSLNPTPGEPPTPNAATTPLSETGTFNVFNRQGEVDLIIDVVGFYTDHDHTDLHYTKAESDDRYYTRAEADATFGPPTESIRIPMLDFQTAQGVGWEFDSFTWGHDDPDDGCLVAPVLLPVGRTVASVDITYFANSPVDVTVTLVGTSTQPIAAATLTTLLDRHLLATATLAAGSFSTVTASVVDDSMEEPSFMTGPVAADHEIALQLCTSGDLAVTGITVEMAPA